MEERTIIIKKGSVSSFLAGALLGAGIALLFAPQSGHQTREIITDKGLELKDRAVDLAKDTADRAQDSLSNARNKLGETMKGMKQGSSIKVDESKQQLKRELEIMEDVNNPSYPL